MRDHHDADRARSRSSRSTSRRSTRCPSRAGSTWPTPSAGRARTRTSTWWCCAPRAAGFNAGVDIKEISATTGFDALVGANRGCYAAFGAVYDCAVPVVAAVHGFCLGGGIGLVGNADVVLASDDATFGVPEVERGALGAATHLARLVPQHLMRALYFTARTITAAELHAHGRCTRWCPRSTLDDAALAVARDIAAKDPRVIRAAKEALNGIDPQQVHRSYRYEQGYTFELNLLGAAGQARQAFLEEKETDG